LRGTRFLGRGEERWVELSADAIASGPMASRRGRGSFVTEAVTFVVVYSLVFAACGGFVFYGSVLRVPEPGGCL
jgi:hypothetical protein